MDWVWFMQQFKADWRKLANLLTEFRLILCIVILVEILRGIDGLSSHQIFVIMIAFIIGSITDCLDGYIARNYNQITELGKYLDPIADKFLSGLAIIALSMTNPLIWYFTAFITVREIYIGWLLNRAEKRGQTVDVLFSGKVKTVVLFVTILVLFIPFNTIVWQNIKSTAMVVSIIISLYSGVEYWCKYSLLNQCEEYSKESGRDS